MLQFFAWLAKASRQQFNDRELERAYRAGRLRRWVTTDRQASLLSLILWVLIAWRLHQLVPSTRLAYSTYLALLFLLPGAWSLAAPSSYARRRQKILLAVRLLPLLFPSLLEAAEHMPPGAVPRHSWNFVAMLVLATRIPAMWVMSLGFRLELPVHTLVHGIKLLRVLCDNPPLCRTSYFQHEVSQRWFRQTALQFDSAFRTLPLRNATLLEGPMNRHEWASCLTVLALVELAVGFILPTLMLYVSERASRAAFLEATQARYRARGVRLPIDIDEFEWFFSWDAPAAWVMMAAAAPFLLAFLWHAILLGVLYLPFLRLPEEEGQPGSASGGSSGGGGMGLGTADVAMAF